MATSTKRATSWPTQADYARVEKAVADAVHALDAFHVHKMPLDLDGEPRDEGCPTPTVADLGRLSVLCECLELHVLTMTNDLHYLQEQHRSAALREVADA